MEIYEEITTNSDVVFKGKIFEVRVDKAKNSVSTSLHREVIIHPGGVVILAIKENKILLVRQFRYGAGEVLYELPAGKLDKPDEKLSDAAKRELSEETGYTASKWTDLGFIYSSPAICNEKIHVFKAENLIAGNPHPDKDENLNVFEIEISKVTEMIKSGEIKDSKTIAAVMKGLFMQREL